MEPSLLGDEMKQEKNMQTTRPINPPPPVSPRTTAQRLAAFKRNLLSEGFSEDEAIYVIALFVSCPNLKDLVTHD